MKTKLELVVDNAFDMIEAGSPYLNLERRTLAQAQEDLGLTNDQSCDNFGNLPMTREG